MKTKHTYLKPVYTKHTYLKPVYTKHTYLKPVYTKHTYYPLANEVAKGYSNATVRPSFLP
jgi:hypothetical protein